MTTGRINQVTELCEKILNGRMRRERRFKDHPQPTNLQKYIQAKNCYIFRLYIQRRLSRPTTDKFPNRKVNNVLNERRQPRWREKLTKERYSVAV